jgi:hypothetical protein
MNRRQRRKQRRLRNIIDLYFASSVSFCLKFSVRIQRSMFGGLPRRLVTSKPCASVEACCRAVAQRRRMAKTGGLISCRLTSVAFETRSLPALARCYLRRLTFYVANPIRPILLWIRSLPVHSPLPRGPAAAGSLIPARYVLIFTRTCRKSVCVAS